MVKFRANELVHGHKWYDWGLVQFDEGISSDNTAPCQIIGFIEYLTPGCPAPKLVTELGYSDCEILDQGMTDDSTYVIVHSSSSYMPWEKLEETFVQTFKLGDVDKCIYIVDVSSMAAFKGRIDKKQD